MVVSGTTNGQTSGSGFGALCSIGLSVGSWASPAGIFPNGGSTSVGNPVVGSYVNLACVIDYNAGQFTIVYGGQQLYQGAFMSSAPKAPWDGVLVQLIAETGSSGAPLTFTPDVNNLTISGAPPTLTWTGKADGVKWSKPGNWDKNVAPGSGSSLVFPGGAPLNPVNDLSGLTINRIDIQGSGYDLTGNPITLTGGLTSEAGNNTYAIATALAARRSLTIRRATSRSMRPSAVAADRPSADRANSTLAWPIPTAVPRRWVPV